MDVRKFRERERVREDKVVLVSGCKEVQRERERERESVREDEVVLVSKI